LLKFRQQCEREQLDIPFLLHAGETLKNGEAADQNLYDCVLLGAKRVGHGFALARHPLLINLFKERNIALEICPISNEILHLTSIIAGHTLPILLASSVACTINCDNSAFFSSSLSHDFYQVMVANKRMNLLGWKTLAMWSIEHSCLSENERVDMQLRWSNDWDKYIRWIIEEFGPHFDRKDSSTDS
jgi:adenosine deaminase CECR1